VTDLSPRWSAELKGVRDGIFPIDESVTEANIHEPGQAFYISPGLAFAPERDTLYVVHADSEQLTTVDFESQKVETVDIRARLTWFERLLALSAGVAHAKIGDGIIRQAVVSPDGQFLYVVGVNNMTVVDQQGNWQMEQTPLGLEILQTSDGSRVSRFESNGTELSLSPDGRFLYLINWGKTTPSTEIFDTVTQQVVLRKDKISAMPTLLMNGEFLLTSAYSTSDTSHHMAILLPDGSSVLAEWTDDESVWWLTP
jgi:DNA-binding beta-propeller fold protein YncE